MTYVFIDTNILLHYRRVDEIDWLTVADVKEVTLIFAPVVIRELDDHKHTHSTKRIRKRASAILSALSSEFANSEQPEIRANVKLLLLSADPNVDFTAHHLRPELNDDWLIGTMVEWREAHPGDRIMLMAADYGLQFKARARQFDVLPAPAEAKLSDTTDASEKRIKQLERENAELKLRIPELRLTFAERATVLSARVPSDCDDPINVDDEIRKIWRDYPHVEIPGNPATRPKHTIGEISRALQQGVQIDFRQLASPEEYERYNEELDAFYSDYEEYLRALVSYREKRRLRVQFEIWLHNDGGTPAEEVVDDIHMHFPDGFELWNTQDEPAGPSPPQPPREIGSHRSLIDPLSHLPDLSSVLLRPTGSAPNVSAPEITRTNSYQVAQTVQRLKHGYSCHLASYTAIFESVPQVRSFQIQYIVSAANLPKPARRSLAVVIAVDSNSAGNSPE